MSRNILVILLLSILLAAPVFGQTTTAVTTSETVIPEGIRNNSFYMESLRLSKLAQETFEYGDYTASASFAQEAIRQAELSDKYVSQQLIREAKRLLVLADSQDIQTRYPNEYEEGKTFYDTSVTASENEEWSESIDAAIKSISALAFLESGRVVTRPPVTPPSGGAGPGADGTYPRPSQYTVRSWAGSRDCLWNIAAQPWAYGDPWKWRILYEANRARMPRPANPNLLEPGFVLEIPSIDGETRQGMWEANRRYTTSR